MVHPAGDGERAIAWLIDGTNVVGSRPDGWWRDRPAAFARLVTRLGVLVSRGDLVTVVFDGRPPALLGEGSRDGVDVLWARRLGRDAADDLIVELVTADPEVAGRRVVTSDRALAVRVQALGVHVVGAGSLLRVLDVLERPGPDD